MGPKLEADFAHANVCSASDLPPPPPAPRGRGGGVPLSNGLDKTGTVR